MDVVGYVRVSTEEQGESGLGLAAQRTAIEAECARRGWNLIQLHEEVKSGAKASNRPALQAALVAVRQGGAGALVVAKLDRLARSVIDFAALLEDAKRRKYNIVALDFGLDLSTPQGELVANVLMSVAQWERRIIGVRTAEGLAAKRAEGWRPLRALQVTASARTLILQLRRDGLSTRAIASALDASGEQPVGKRWYRGTILRVLAQERPA